MCIFSERFLKYIFLEIIILSYLLNKKCYFIITKELGTFHYKKKIVVFFSRKYI